MDDPYEKWRVRLRLNEMGNPLQRLHSPVFLAILIAAVTLIIIFGFGAFSWYSYDVLGQEQLALSETQAVRTRLAFATHVEHILDYGDSYLRSARFIYGQNGTPDMMRQAMHEVRSPRDASIIDAVLVMDETGRMVFHSGDVVHEEVNVADLQFFRSLRDDPTDRLIIDPTRVGRATGQLQFRLVRPLLKNGRFAGVIVLTMNPEHFTRYYYDLQLGPHTASMLLTTDLHVIAREPAANLSDFGHNIPGLQVWHGHDLEMEPSGSLRQSSVIDAITRTFYYTKIANFPLVVSIGVADVDIASRSEGTRVNLILLVTAFTVTVVIISSLLIAFIQANAKLQRAHAESERAADQVRQANIRLQGANQLLEQSNADLEQFAYVSSHDLQTPLRNITSFTQLLARRYGELLDKDGQDYIAFIVDSSHQMSLLIRDLLEYSRLSSQALPLTQVSAKQAVDKVLLVLSPLIKQCNATVTVGELPTIRAEEGQLIRLFQNLLENAIKYRSTDRPTAIRIWAELADSRMWKLFVADNGIGIEPEYFEKIFVIFQRLHPAKRYEGTGIGLAICKRIVNRMGGEIGVTSTPGQGATFFFTAHRPEENQD